jgi:hypothetical protein
LCLCPLVEPAVRIFRNGLCSLHSCPPHNPGKCRWSNALAGSSRPSSYTGDQIVQCGPCSQGKGRTGNLVALQRESSPARLNGTSRHTFHEHEARSALWNQIVKRVQLKLFHEVSRLCKLLFQNIGKASLVIEDAAITASDTRNRSCARVLISALRAPEQYPSS